MPSIHHPSDLHVLHLADTPVPRARRLRATRQRPRLVFEATAVTRGRPVISSPFGARSRDRLPPGCLGVIIGFRPLSTLCVCIDCPCHRPWGGCGCAGRAAKGHPRWTGPTFRPAMRQLACTLCRSDAQCSQCVNCRWVWKRPLRAIANILPHVNGRCLDCG